MTVSPMQEKSENRVAIMVYAPPTAEASVSLVSSGPVAVEALIAWQVSCCVRFCFHHATQHDATQHYLVDTTNTTRYDTHYQTSPPCQGHDCDCVLRLGGRDLDQQGRAAGHTTERWPSFVIRQISYRGTG